MSSTWAGLSQVGLLLLALALVYKPLFATMLGGTIVLVAALTFIPALALGPIAEALA
jgi:K+-transporting ATPase A subunit